MFKLNTSIRFLIAGVLSLALHALIEPNTALAQKVGHHVTVYKSDSELSENAVMLDEKSLSSASVGKGGGSLAFSIDQTSKTLKDRLKRGAVLIGGVSPNTPEGLLVKVVGASQKDGVLTLETKPASLTEAFKNLSLEAHVKLFSCSNEKDDIEGCLQIPIHASLDAVLYDEDGILVRTVDSYLEVSIEFCLGFEIVNFQLVYAHFDPYIAQKLRVLLEATAEYDFEGSATLWEAPLGAVPIGPLVIVPEFGISANAYGSLDATLTTGIEQEFSLDYTIAYDIEDADYWDFYGDCDKSFNFIEPVLTGAAQATVSLKPELILKLYGVAGPFVNVEGGFTFAGELQAGKSLDICWDVSTLLKANGGVMLDVVLFQIESPEFGLFSLPSYTLASGCISSEAPITIRITDIRNTMVSAGGTVGPIRAERTNNTGSYYEYNAQKYITDPTGATKWFPPKLRHLDAGATETLRGSLHVASGAVEGEHSAGIVFTDLADNEIDHDSFDFTVTGGASKSPGTDELQGWEYKTTDHEDNH